jgi:hypothetical protein
LKLLFSAKDESIKVEIATFGHDEVAHSKDSLLTPTVKQEIKKWAKESLKPNNIRLKLLVSR